MTRAATAPLQWDPYDFALARHPFEAFKRLRDEAPLYYNDKYDFYAMSRFHDCQAGLVNREQFISGKGVIMEMIKAGYPSPPGLFIHDDPPIHTMYRILLTPPGQARRTQKRPEQVRHYCARTLDPLMEA